MDTKRHGYLVQRDFDQNLRHIYERSLSRDQLKALFTEIDGDHSGIVSIEEFTAFYKKNYIQELARIEMQKHTSHSVTEIFEHLITVLKAKGKTLLEVFDVD